MIHIRATGCHLPYEITVLAVGRHKWTQAGTRFTYSGRMGGWVDLGDRLHTEMVYRRRRQTTHPRSLLTWHWTTRSQTHDLLITRPTSLHYQATLSAVANPGPRLGSRQNSIMEIGHYYQRASYSHRSVAVSDVCRWNCMHDVKIVTAASAAPMVTSIIKVHGMLRQGATAPQLYHTAEYSCLSAVLTVRGTHCRRKLQLLGSLSPALFCCILRRSGHSWK